MKCTADGWLPRGGDERLAVSTVATQPSWPHGPLGSWLQKKRGKKRKRLEDRFTFLRLAGIKKRLKRSASYAARPKKKKKLETKWLEAAASVGFPRNGRGPDFQVEVLRETAHFVEIRLPFSAVATIKRLQPRAERQIRPAGAGCRGQRCVQASWASTCVPPLKPGASPDKKVLDLRIFQPKSTSEASEIRRHHEFQKCEHLAHDD